MNDLGEWSQWRNRQSLDLSFLVAGDPTAVGTCSQIMVGCTGRAMRIQFVSWRSMIEPLEEGAGVRVTPVARSAIKCLGLGQVPLNAIGVIVVLAEFIAAERDASVTRLAKKRECLERVPINTDAFIVMRAKRTAGEQEPPVTSFMKKRETPGLVFFDAELVS